MSNLDFKYNVDEAATYAAYAPILWSTFIISLIFLCHKSRGGNVQYINWITESKIISCVTGLVGTVLRWQGFQVFTKISYAVYLTQFPVYFYYVGTTKYSGYSYMSDLVKFQFIILKKDYSKLKFQFSLTELRAVLIASVLLTLVVDLPFQDIKKIVTEEKGRLNNILMYPSNSLHHRP